MFVSTFLYIFYAIFTKAYDVLVDLDRISSLHMPKKYEKACIIIFVFIHILDLICSIWCR